MRRGLRIAGREYKFLAFGESQAKFVLLPLVALRFSTPRATCSGSKHADRHSDSFVDFPCCIDCGLQGKVMLVLC